MKHNLKHGKRTITPRADGDAEHARKLAQSFVMEGESDTRFAEIAARIDTELMPEGECETALADMMAVARWRQMRIWGMEKAALRKGIEALKETRPEMAGQDFPSQAAEAFQALADESQVLGLLNRYETMSLRTFFRAQRYFQRLREME